MPAPRFGSPSTEHVTSEESRAARIGGDQNDQLTRRTDHPVLSHEMTTWFRSSTPTDQSKRFDSLKSWLERAGTGRALRTASPQPEAVVLARPHVFVAMAGLSVVIAAARNSRPRSARRGPKSALHSSVSTDRRAASPDCRIEDAYDGTRSPDSGIASSGAARRRREGESCRWVGRAVSVSRAMEA